MYAVKVRVSQMHGQRESKCLDFELKVCALKLEL